MQIYLAIITNTVVNFDTERRGDDDLCLDVSSFEELQNKLSKQGISIDDSLELEIESSFEDISIEDNKFIIKHWVSNRSIGELIDMFDNEEIIKPTMQRSLVWDSTKSSRLIESVLIGLPIPPLFMIEVDKSKYELVDGLQRLSTFTNYIRGYTWNGKKENQRPCKLSASVMSSIAGKTFMGLSPDQQRILKRSTIPLIEFKQLEPNNNEAKYLIFERINTGSVKLTSMQIRKALASGDFMSSLYNLANSNKKFISLFSNTNIKKDVHVEALLRIIVITEIYNLSFETRETNIGKILNCYCENKKNESIDISYIKTFNQAVDVLYSLFADSKNICRKVISRKGIIEYYGTIQITILEAMMGTIIKHKIKRVDNFEDKYKKVMSDMYQQLVESMDLTKNPFSYSTGTRDSIERRYRICESVLLEK